MNDDDGVSVFDFTLFSQNFGTGIVYSNAFARDLVTRTPSKQETENESETNHVFEQRVLDRAVIWQVPDASRGQEDLEFESFVDGAELEVVIDQLAEEVGLIWAPPLHSTP